MRKILFAINKFTLGGAETVVLNEINLINKQNFDPYLGIMYSTSKSTNLYGSLNLPARKIVHFDFKRLIDPWAFFRLYRFLRDGRFDAVAGNLFEANFAVRVAGMLAGVPVLIAVEHSSYSNKTAWQKVADRILARKTAAIVAPSENIADFTAKDEKIPRSKFVRVGQISDLSPRGVFTREYLRSSLEIPNKAFVCLTIGRFSPEKAQERVIQIAEQIVHKEKRNNIFFVLVGYGAREEELRQLIAGYHLERWVKIISDTAAQAKEYNICGDVFLLPSKREGVPLALLEAMHAGLVPVCSDLGGIREVVSNSGFVFKEGDIGSIVSAILALADDPVKVERLGTLATSAAEQARGKISDLEKLLERLIVRSQTR